MGIGTTIITFLISILVSLLCTPPFIQLMVKYKILDKSGGRKIHTGYTAHMGGIVIYLAFLVSCLALTFMYGNDFNIRLAVFIAVILTIMLLVGIRDDIHNISPIGKLFAEILVGIFMSYIGIRISNFGGFLGLYEIPMWFSYCLTIGFFVVVVNAYNLIDGVDGQAGMQALNVFIFVALFYLLIIGEKRISGMTMSPKFIYVAIVAMIGAICGFLKYNWQKASIFMGDAGSLFIGTAITMFILVSSKHAYLVNHYDIINGTADYALFGHHLKAIFAPFIAIFYLPMADTLRVFTYRVVRNRSPFSADKTHIHHFLIRVGYSHQRCTLTTFTISFCISILFIVLAFFFNDNVCISMIVVSWFLYVFLLKVFTRRNMEKYEEMKQKRIAQRKENI